MRSVRRTTYVTSPAAAVLMSPMSRWCAATNVSQTSMIVVGSGWREDSSVWSAAAAPSLRAGLPANAATRRSRREARHGGGRSALGGVTDCLRRIMERGGDDGDSPVAPWAVGDVVGEHGDDGRSDCVVGL
jgi:hypothetical protein